jgi:hypothetical protein
MAFPAPPHLTASLRVRLLPEQVEGLAAAAAARGMRSGTLLRHWLCQCLEQEQATDQRAA